MNVIKTASIADAFTSIEHEPLDLALVDFHLVDGKGAELIARIREHSQKANIPIIMMTAGLCEQSQLDEVRLLNVIEVLRKPLHPDALCKALAKALPKLAPESKVRTGSLSTVI